MSKFDKDMDGVENVIALWGDSQNVGASLFSHPSMHDKEQRESVYRCRSSSYVFIFIKHLSRGLDLHPSV